MKEKLASFNPVRYVSAARRGQGANIFRPPSVNALVTGSDLVRAFRGVALTGLLGSRIFFNTDQSFAGLGTQSTQGGGSVFNARQLLMAIGSGQVNFAGAAIATFLATSTLSYSKKTMGSYGAPIYQAGRAQPSAPLIFAKSNPSAGQTPMTGAVSVGIWRSSDIDGQVSLVSLPSNVLTLSNQSLIVSFDGISVDTNGQNFWGIGVPKIGYADLGSLIQLPTSLGGEPAESSLSTIDGIARAREISWTNGALLEQPLAPTTAFPPPAGDFAGSMNDVLFVDSGGIIYVSDPGYIGSFPPSSALFTQEPAIAYLKIGDGAYARFGAHSFGVLAYVGGTPALEYQTIWNNLGIKLPTNVAVGAHGRLLMFLGRPAVVENSAEPDYEYAKEVLPDFVGWDSQDATRPVAIGYDPLGLYEVWSYQKKVMAKFVPDGRWCSPVDLTGKVTGNVCAWVTTGQKLYCATFNAGGDLNFYQYDPETGGTGSAMVLQTDDTAPGYGDTVTEIFLQARGDNGVNNLAVDLIRDMEDESPVSIMNAVLSEFDEPQLMRLTANVLNARTHALKVSFTSAGGDAGVDLLESYGARSEVRI